MFGQKKFFSPVDGVIKEIDHQSGIIIVSDSKKEKKTVKSYFRGEVVSLKKDNFDLEIGKGEGFSIKGSGVNFGGQTLYPDENNIAQLNSADVNQKIVIIESVSTLTQSKMEVLGASGLVSLNQPPELNGVLLAQIKNQDDFKKIIAKKYPYCLVDYHSSKIYFYEFKKNN